ncbi:type II secretion system protein GspM [Pseudomarimonas salicorniae]|uniref:Type II secretion system protein M n=1 Tax=Pseudomarimonas salicorniae TaxID=2933270 RepID=A0ABT0GEC3_9GAMM|nr:type II secretion system protein M [Lysobacter sp. CAU 1642]MCK7592783.1 type II secretion system protein M [Lysobacter sp. CAU 1642]
MRAWWQGLAERERRLVRFGAGLALLMLWFGLLFAPAREARDQWRQRAESADAALRWMQAAASQLSARPAAPAALDDRRSLLARVDEGARSAGLGTSLLRVEPLANGRVRIQLQAAPFDQTMDWLQPLRAQGVQVEELSVQRSTGVGLVDARITLAAPGG